VEADSFVTKAGAVVQDLPNPNDHRSLLLRYKSTYAQILDANRKFLQAASRYYELSQLTSEVDADELLHLLGRAATCAILAPTGTQRQRILGLVYKDQRLVQIDGIDEFSTHSSIVRKMYMNQALKSHEIRKFEESLAEHQRTIFERVVTEHNILAVGKLYTNIYLTELANSLGVDVVKAEKLVAGMIVAGSLKASIDQVDGLLSFENAGCALLSWDDAITHFCVQLNRIAEEISNQ